MLEDDKTKLLLTLGPKENQLLKEISHLIKDGKYPNKTEIFRRGFYSAIQLMEVNENTLLQLLRMRIERSAQSLDKTDFELILALSLVIYAILIAKKGTIAAEPFETILNTCKQLHLINNSQIDKNNVITVLHNLASVVDTVFLKKDYTQFEDNLGDFKTVKSYDQNSTSEENNEKLSSESEWALMSLFGVRSKQSTKSVVPLGMI